MSITVKLGTLQDTKLQLDGQVQRYTRGAFFTGIPNNLSDIDMLYACTVATNMPAPSAPLSAHYPSLIFTRLQLVPIGGGCATGQLIYETPSGFPPSSYIIRDSSTLTTYETNMIPGTRIPIAIPDCDIKFPGDSSTTTVTGDNVTIRILRPIRQVSVARLVFGDPTATSPQTWQPFNPITSIMASPSGNYNYGGGGSVKPEAVGKVNNAPWGVPNGPTYPMGWWLCSEFVTDTYKYQGYYTTQAAALCRGEPWDEMGILRSEKTGKYVPVDATAGWFSNMMSAPYKYGIIAQPADKGVIRVGPYETTNMADVFGF